MCFESLLNKLLESELLQNKAKADKTPDFFVSAVKTARLSTRKTRLKIISDMADVLGCASEDLLFLFEESLPLNDNYTQTAVPNFRQAMRLEAGAEMSDVGILEAAE